MKPLDFQKKVGQKVKTARAKAGLSQQKAAGLAISLRGYQKIENGESNIRIQSLFEIGRNLGVHPKIFLDFDIDWFGFLVDGFIT